MEELIKPQVQTHAPGNGNDTSKETELVKHRLAGKRRRREQPSEARKALPLLSPSAKGTLQFHFQGMIRGSANLQFGCSFLPVKPDAELFSARPHFLP